VKPCNNNIKACSVPFWKSIELTIQQLFFADSLDYTCLQDIQFTADDILQSITELKSASSAGPDGFPAVYLKECARGLSIPLEMMWRLSLNSERIESGKDYTCV